MGKLEILLKWHWTISLELAGNDCSTVCAPPEMPQICHDVCMDVCPNCNATIECYYSQSNCVCECDLDWGYTDLKPKAKWMDLNLANCWFSNNY